jgi:DNA-binding NarL/FixJ family response regulator
MFAQAVRLLLQGETDLETVQTANSAEEALALAERICPDIVLMDIDLPGLDGIEATRLIRTQCPMTRVIVITALRDQDLIARAVEAGASGFLRKTRAAEELISTIKGVVRGGIVLPEDGLSAVVSRSERVRAERAQLDATLSSLTARELEVLRSLDAGATTEDIAGGLGVARVTVQSHVNSILAKFGVRTRLQAVLLYRGHR